MTTTPATSWKPCASWGGVPLTPTPTPPAAARPATLAAPVVNVTDVAVWCTVCGLAMTPHVRQLVADKAREIAARRGAAISANAAAGGPRLALPHGVILEAARWAEGAFDALRMMLPAPHDGASDDDLASWLLAGGSPVPVANSLADRIRSTQRPTR